MNRSSAMQRSRVQITRFAGYALNMFPRRFTPAKNARKNGGNLQHANVPEMESTHSRAAAAEKPQRRISMIHFPTLKPSSNPK